MQIFPIHVRTASGLEAVLAKELEDLGATEVVPKSRVVLCKGDKRFLYKANLWCRTGMRVLKALESFSAEDEKAFYQGIKNISWENWLSSTGTLAIDADVRSSFTTHSLFIAQLSKDAIVDRFREKTGRRPSVDLENPDIRIVVSLFENHVQVYLDASGESLHKRGYRKKTGAAPISEVLAAGILKLSGWDEKSPLVDPMCGAGTFGIEAALMAKNFAPGLFKDAIRKRFGFQKWPDYDSNLYEELVREAKKAVRSKVPVSILSLDKDEETLSIAKENAERAGVADLFQAENADFFEWKPSEKGTVIFNPPYDERLPVDNIAELYHQIGNRLKIAYPGWTAYMMAGNLDAIDYVGLKPSQRNVLLNGAIECRLLKYEIHDGARRPIEMKKPLPVPGPWQKKMDTFANRLEKNFKHFSKWAEREKISCWRVYDWDIPELAFIVDIYGDRMHFAEIQRNLQHSPLDHTRYMQGIVDTAARVLKIDPDKVYFKKRKPQRTGGFQYAVHDETKEFVEVTEGGHKFLVNLADYLDVGLFLDHRKTRAMVEKEAKGKDFLNLFAYTGSFSVYAAAGGAKSTTTVDTSSTYLEWAENNLRLNGFTSPVHRLIRSDTLEFLDSTNMSFDLCVVDPPTKSVNRSSERVFDVQEDQAFLLELVLKIMRPGGKVFFSTNYRSFQIDEAAIQKVRPVEIKEITGKTLPLDFQRKPSHRCWLITCPL